MTEPDDTVGRHRATTWTPQRKVASGAISGAAAVLVFWAIGSLGVELPAEVAAEVAAAITALVTARVAYLVPSETA